MHPHLVKMQSQGTDAVTVYLGSPWVTGKPFRVTLISSISLQSLRAPSPLCVLASWVFHLQERVHLLSMPNSSSSKAHDPSLVLLDPLLKYCVICPSFPVSFWTETHRIAWPSLAIMVLLPQPPDFWDHKHRPPCPTSVFFLFPYGSQLITL